MGAASFLPDDPAVSRALQQLEVRAFGCLLEELLQRAHAKPDAGLLKALADLRDDCLQEAVGARPLYAAIAERLAGLKASA